MNNKKFSKEELRKRVFLRVARIIYELWEEGEGIDTRILEEWLVPNDMVTIGVSKKGYGRREHLVPRIMIINESDRMFNSGASIEDVANMIEKHLKIAHISRDEAKLIDSKLGLKMKMPEGWKFNEGSVLARLEVAGVELA